MNIKVHTSLVLAICTLTGVVLGGFLTSRSRRIDEDLSGDVDTHAHDASTNQLINLARSHRASR